MSFTNTVLVKALHRNDPLLPGPWNHDESIFPILLHSRLMLVRYHWCCEINQTKCGCGNYAGELANEKTALMRANPLWGKQGQTISWFSLTEPAFPCIKSRTQLINSVKKHLLFRETSWLTSKHDQSQALEHTCGERKFTTIVMKKGNAWRI